jgi:dipeptidyl-peptidase-4
MLVIVDFLAGEPGAPHAVQVGGDGARVAFLRGSALYVLDVATGKLREIAAGPIDAYAIDTDARTAAFSRAGELVRADLIGGTLTPFETDKPAVDPRPDASGGQIGYLSGGGIHVAGPNGDQLLAGEPGVVWGGPGEPEFGRRRGWWWSPDGSQILATRTAGAAASLHLLDLWGGWVDVHWDRETYPYLVEVRWQEGGPLITVLRRTQQHGLVLSIDPRTGETQVHAELADARWVEPVTGTPRYLPDGRVLVGGELAHDGFDARCLFADGSLLTPPKLYVRRVVGVLPRTTRPTAAGPDLIVEGTDGDPAEQHVFAVRTSLGGGPAEARRITRTPGWHSAVIGGDVLVLASASLSGETAWRVHRGGTVVATLPSTPAPAPAPRPVLERVTDRRLPSAVLYPPGHVTGHKLPVLLDLGDGPGHQQITLARAGWPERQWWAAAGFAVVSVDSRGTPGVAPSFEKVVYRRLADVVLADHVDALQALTGKHPDLDLEAVSVRGKGLGGWLAAMAVLRRTDLFRRGAARDPVLDWTTQPAAFAERYLGRLADSPDVYAHHSLLEELPSDRLLVLDSAADNARELDFLQEHA